MIVTSTKTTQTKVLVVALAAVFLTLIYRGNETTFFVTAAKQNKCNKHHHGIVPTPSLLLSKRRTTSSPTFGIVSVIPRGGAGRRSVVVTKPVKQQPVPRKAKGKVVVASSTPTVAGTGTASVTSEVFNLVKNIVGVAVLSLPASIATFGDEPSVLVPVIGLIIGIGILSGYGFSVIGKVCSYTGATSYREAWGQSVSATTAWLPAGAATLKTFSTCMAISMVLADTFGTLLNRSPSQRTQTLVGLTLGIILPLCWMKNLASLAPFSLLGVLGIVYTGIAMTIRYLDGSYSTDSAKSVLASIPSQYHPKFGTNGWQAAFQPATLVLLCTLSTAFMAHFNAPKFYLELYNNTLPRYYQVVSLSYLASILLMGYITVIGFLTFGKNAASVILSNYASSDLYMSLSRVAVAVSLVFTYPLAFQGCRDGILDLLQIPKEKRNVRTLNITTIVLLGIITFLAAILKDVGFVLAVGGATLGNALAYIFPAIMYYGVVTKQKRTNETVGLSFSIVSAVLGVFMGAIGTKMAFKK